jgi:hypothetical protein
MKRVLSSDAVRIAAAFAGAIACSSSFAFLDLDAQTGSRVVLGFFTFLTVLARPNAVGATGAAGVLFAGELASQIGGV